MLFAVFHKTIGFPWSSYACGFKARSGCLVEGVGFMGFSLGFWAESLPAAYDRAFVYEG